MRKSSAPSKAGEWLGWYGMIAILAAYGLLSFSILQPHDLVYQLLNGTGALGLVIDGLAKKDRPVVVLNALFTLIALISLIRILYAAS